MKHWSTLMAVSLILATSQAAIAAPSFTGDWESGSVTGKGNTNWRSLESVAPDRFTLINDGVRPGTYARVEVRSGDNPLAGCCYESDRAEVHGMQNADDSPLAENLASGTQQYHVSVKFDETWQPITGPGEFGMFLQLHGPDAFGTSPALAFNATDQIRLFTLTGDIDTSSAISHDMSNGSLNIGKWIDFIFTVGFAADDSGFINVSRRDEGDASFTQVLSLTNTPTLQYSSSFADGAVMDHYWKHGFYRSRQEFTSVVYLDGFTRQQVAVVPEPQSVALMIAGIGLIGMVLRRRRYTALH